MLYFGAIRSPNSWATSSIVTGVLVLSPDLKFNLCTLIALRCKAILINRMREKTEHKFFSPSSTAFFLRENCLADDQPLAGRRIDLPANDWSSATRFMQPLLSWKLAFRKIVTWRNRSQLLDVNAEVPLKYLLQL